jgi:hypothetical protein
MGEPIGARPIRRERKAELSTLTSSVELERRLKLDLLLDVSLGDGRPERLLGSVQTGHVRLVVLEETGGEGGEARKDELISIGHERRRREGADLGVVEGHDLLGDVRLKGLGDGRSSPGQHGTRLYSELEEMDGRRNRTGEQAACAPVGQRSTQSIGPTSGEGSR